MRIENFGNIQPYRTFLYDQNCINKEDFASLLCEDQYKDELFYVDYLADVHVQIQSKMN